MYVIRLILITQPKLRKEKVGDMRGKIKVWIDSILSMSYPGPVSQTLIRILILSCLMFPVIFLLLLGRHDMHGLTQRVFVIMDIGCLLVVVSLVIIQVLESSSLIQGKLIVTQVAELGRGHVDEAHGFQDTAWI